MHVKGVRAMRVLAHCAFRQLGPRGVGGWLLEPVLLCLVRRLRLAGMFCFSHSSLASLEGRIRVNIRKRGHQRKVSLDGCDEKLFWRHEKLFWRHGITLSWRKPCCSVPKKAQSYNRNLCKVQCGRDYCLLFYTYPSEAIVCRCLSVIHKVAGS